jgi:hypothetical protein
LTLPGFFTPTPLPTFDRPDFLIPGHPQIVTGGLGADGLVPWTDTIGARFDRDFPGRLYVIAPVRRGEYPDTARLEKLIGMPASPVLLRLNGTVIGTLDANEFITANSGVLLGAPTPPYHLFRDGTTIAEAADACIYRGRGVDTPVRPDPSYAADTAYAAELKRRAGFAPPLRPR